MPTEDVKYIRNCYKCNREITYNTITAYRKANKIDKNCKSCAAKSRKINQENEKKRIEKIIYYQKHLRSKDSYEKAGKNISKAKMGHIVTKETREKISCSHKGKKLTEEHKNNIKNSLRTGGAKKISNALMGRKLSKETVDKMSKSKIGHKFNVGKKHTIEHNNKISKGNKGKKMSDDSKRKCRIAAIKRIESNIGYQLSPNFNRDACKIIDEYGKKHGYNFQHALNGGEFLIKGLGYFVDGYDKEKNVVIEYYEKHHYKNGLLRIKDIKRKNEIINYLNCNFIELGEQ